MKKVSLFELAEVYKSPKKGVVYPKGTILVQTSATKGDVILLTEEQEVEDKYAVILPNNNLVEPEYLFLVIQKEFKAFLHKVRSGLNFRAEELKNFYFSIHTEKEKQKQIVKFIKIIGLFQQH